MPPTRQVGSAKPLMRSRIPRAQRRAPQGDVVMSEEGRIGGNRQALGTPGEVIRRIPRADEEEKDTGLGLSCGMLSFEGQKYAVMGSSMLTSSFVVHVLAISAHLQRL